MARNRNKNTEPLPPGGSLATPEEITEVVEKALRPACRTCPYWNYLSDDAKLGAVGECRRLPPTLRDPLLLTLSGPVVRFGLTLADTSCGEHPRFLSLS